MIDLYLFELSPYTFGIALGAAVALSLGDAYARQIRLPRSLFWNAAPAAAVLALAGARLLFVLEHQAYYGSNPDQVFDFRQGGLAWHGALFGGALALALATALSIAQNHPRPPLRAFWRLADTASVGMPLVMMLGWLGAHAIGAHYGALDDSALAQELPDAYGIYDLRFPVQLAAALWYGLAAVILLRAAWPLGGGRFAAARPAGKIASLFLILSAAGDFGLTFFRGEPMAQWQGLAVNQWLDLGVSLVGLYGWLTAGRMPRTVRPIQKVEFNNRLEV